MVSSPTSPRSPSSSPQSPSPSSPLYSPSPSPPLYSPSPSSPSHSPSSSFSSHSPSHSSPSHSPSPSQSPAPSLSPSPHQFPSHSPSQSPSPSTFPLQSITSNWALFMPYPDSEEEEEAQSPSPSLSLSPHQFPSHSPSQLPSPSTFPLQSIPANWALFMPYQDSEEEKEEEEEDESPSTLPAASSPGFVIQTVQSDRMFMVVEFVKGPYSYYIFDIDVADPRDRFLAWSGGVDELSPNPTLRLHRGEFQNGMIFFSGETHIYMVGDSGQSFHIFDPRDNNITRGRCMVSSMENPIVLGSLETQTFLISDNLSLHQFEMFDHLEERWSPRNSPPVPPGVVTVLSAHAVVRRTIAISIHGLGILIYYIDTDYWTTCHLGPERSVFPFSGFAQHFNGRWYVLQADSKEYPLYAYEEDHSHQLFGKGQRVNNIQPLQPASDSKKPLLFQRTGAVVPMGRDSLCIVRAGYDGLQMGLCFPSHRAGVTRFQLESSGNQLSAVNQHSAMYSLRSFSLSMPTVRGCFSMIITRERFFNTG